MINPTMETPTFSIVAEWTKHEPNDPNFEYHFVIKTNCRDVQRMLTTLSETHGIPGERWYWDSANDNGRTTDATMTIVFNYIEDALLFKLTQD